MQRVFFTTVFFFFCWFGNAQTSLVIKDSSEYRSIRLSKGIKLLERADYFQNKDHHLKAVHYALKALNTLPNTNQTDSIFAYTYYILGVSYQSLYRLYKSEAYYLASLYRFQKLSNKSLFINRIHQLLGTLYHSLNPEKSIQYFMKGINNPKNHKVIIYNNISLAYTYQQKKQDSAIFYAYQALENVNTSNYHSTQANRLKATIFHNLGFAYQQKGQPNQARQYFQQSLGKLQKLKAHHHTLYYYNHIKLGESYQQQKQWLLAFDHFKVANQKAKLAKNNLAHLQALSGQNRAFSKLYYHDFRKLTLTIYHYHQCDSLIKLLQQKRDFYRDQLDFAALTTQTYEAAFQTCFKLYQQTHNKDYLQKAFYFMERAKAQVLWQAHLQARHRLHNVEGQLLLDSLASTQHQINQSNSPKGQLYEQLIRLYQQTKHLNARSAIADTLQRISQVRQKLKPTTAMLEYFVASGQVYGLLITQNQPVQLKYLAQVKDINRLVTRFHILLQEIENYDLLATTTYQLYQKLVAPFNQALRGKNRLVIIPDQQLWKIPFSVLSFKLPSKYAPDTDKFRQLKASHLVHRYAISYNYSANLWSKASPIDTLRAFSHKLLGVAPGFIGGRKKWGIWELPQSLAGLATLDKVYASTPYPITLLTREQATLGRFLKQYRQGAEIVQLTTHSETGRLAHIKFLPPPGKNPDVNHLYLDNIYYLPPQARLMILNSCSSGAGPIHRTEGLLSLSRGFIQSGVPNVIFNLWDIQDSSKTSTLMTSLHQGLLRSSTSYAYALQHSKIALLQSTQNGLVVPKDWASFMLIDNYLRQ